ncbi:TetR/AcrR family transcriptional regulator [Desulfosoma caldarium]|uniref:TetR family transcriptional regulator n=1 Tax=Desulfosoma caldarium TaxID=610254 RepID=A0A3N1UUF1_9BACT|nr:TetR/AcrR family transcriptional regulator [Desulfosoma caldarium]ROQ92167.1 TetR family transcriptional regulator [Desulfosoma caldarium]
MKEDRKNTAAEILKAARQLFYEKSYEAASTREISARVGISKAALYHHFRNKEEILFRICLEAADELVDNMRRAIARNVASGKPLKEQLTDILIEYLRTYLKNENFNKILFHDMEYLPEDKRRIILDKEKENVHQLRAFLISLMDQGAIRRINPTVMTFSLISSLHWLYFWYNPKGPLSLEDVAQEIADLFLHGMLAR